MRSIAGSARRRAPPRRRSGKCRPPGYARGVPYPLTSSRLVIEPLAASDVGAFVGYRQEIEVARWQSWTLSYSESDARQLIEGQPTTELPEEGKWIQLAVRDARGGTLHGDVAVHVLAGQPSTFEIGATLAPGSQKQGVAAEAVARVLDYLFTEATAHRVVAFCDARNEPVARLLRRVGMRRESSQVEADFFKGEWTTLDGYAVLAREWAAADR